MKTPTNTDARSVPLHRLVRISICGMPALLWGALFAIFDPTFGGLCVIAGFWLGWQCTEARPERGESDNPNVKTVATEGAGESLTEAAQPSSQD